ncbi:hypothetical protein EVAR_42027_1 [Eumeta japonica]|uniref:Uncharacterized protein n=1 Tax=Eumeta variegata TaxID=151549 RepID=A0A4C1Y9K4_EUMVA|nr:hypothetical protein EVAR_42027_1 [Eumeta japonica]
MKPFPCAESIIGLGPHSRRDGRPAGVSDAADYGGRLRGLSGFSRQGRRRLVRQPALVDVENPRQAPQFEMERL